MPSEMTSSTAPFSKAIETAFGQARSAAEEFSRLFGQMRFPGLPDSEAVMATHRRNFEALAEANRTALEGAQTVARRHMEITQQTMAELSESLRSLNASAPQDRAAQQADMLKRAYERATEHARELNELIQQANGDALAKINRRFVEAVDEIKALMDKAASANKA